MVRAKQVCFHGARIACNPELIETLLAALAEARRFSEAEVNILRDIRRRGKNLIAAHSCRNRKLAEIKVISYTAFNFVLKYCLQRI